MIGEAKATPSQAHAARTAAAILEGAQLAFVAGFVDTCGFIALFGLFTAHVTGNFVLIGAAIADYHGGLIAKLLALPLFVIVVAISRTVTVMMDDRRMNAAIPLLGFQILFLAGFLACGVLAGPMHEGDAPLAVLTGMLAVTAMAIQNTASRTVFTMHTPTTVMTGNVTQVVIDLVDLSLGRANAEVRLRVRKMVPAILAFTVGAASGALGYVFAGFWCLVAPIAILLLVFGREIGRKG
jgi:uncharacterized membrane protein YoaK (UPF0700 family)